MHHPGGPSTSTRLATKMPGGSVRTSLAGSHVLANHLGRAATGRRSATPPRSDCLLDCVLAVDQIGTATLRAKHVARRLAATRATSAPRRVAAKHRRRELPV